MPQSIHIHWFRQDLRLSDNPALTAAAAGGAVLPIYLLDPKHPMGSASRVWLHHSLLALQNSLGGKLSVYHGDPLSILLALTERYDVAAVHWNRCYEPWQRDRDTHIKAALTQAGIDAQSHNGSLLWEPWTIQKKDGTPYKVFTPFYRKGCLLSTPPREPLAAPKLNSLITDHPHSCSVEELGLLPSESWDKAMMTHWRTGEEEALAKLDTFLHTSVGHYKEGRNLPAKPYTSRLSPHLHFGELSPNQAWHAARQSGDDDNIDCFCSELGWREFAYSQLYFHPDLAKQNLQRKFDHFPWQTNKKHLTAWQKGLTGIPIVDAGMRELWQTGYMHNRVRMIVGSFLVKNLLLDWRHGEAWFWDCLLDADLASNSASWQWVAGCGTDAAPYFRVFNPVTQGKKFDPDGTYTRQFVPELNNLPGKYLFDPWEAPDAVLADAGITLGDTYPAPLVDLKQSRQRALDAFQSLKKES